MQLGQRVVDHMGTGTDANGQETIGMGQRDFDGCREFGFFVVGMATHVQSTRGRRRVGLGPYVLVVEDQKRRFTVPMVDIVQPCRDFHLFVWWQMVVHLLHDPMGQNTVAAEKPIAIGRRATRRRFDEGTRRIVFPCPSVVGGLEIVVANQPPLLNTANNDGFR